MTVANLLDKLERVRPTGPGRWLACCPAHEDNHPSLSVRETGDGTVLVHDFAGCEVTEILFAVGMELKDLFPANEQSYRAPTRPRHNLLDVLRAISHETTLVYTAAIALKNGPLSPEDLERLALAKTRINAALMVTS